MKRTVFEVKINLDPVLGWGHEPEDHVKFLRDMLEKSVGWYKPEVRLVRVEAMDPLPDYGDCMTLSEFIDGVNSGLFTDDDGHGKYASDKEISNQLATPSDIKRGIVMDGWSHVVWFNR